MIITLDVREHNKQVYCALFEEMEKKKNGLFTFIIRVSAGDIVDFVIYENITADNFKDYGEQQLV